MTTATQTTTTTITVVDREGESHPIPWEEGETLMEALRDNDLPVLASCGGCCSCATCHVFVDPQLVAVDRDGEEQELLEETDAYNPACSRLSCQLTYTPDYAGMTVTLAPEE